MKTSDFEDLVAGVVKKVVATVNDWQAGVTEEVFDDEVTEEVLIEDFIECLREELP